MWSALWVRQLTLTGMQARPCAGGWCQENAFVRYARCYTMAGNKYHRPQVRILAVIM